MKPGRRVVVVGAGPGALAAAARLRERAGDAAELLLIAPGLEATFLAGTVDVALGDAEPDRFTTSVALEGIRCIDAAVDRVAPDGALAAGEWFAADAVIAAPGLALDHAAIPGWSRAVSAWDPAGAAHARARLAEVAAGRVLIAPCALPYRCPPAPFALAVRLADQHFKARHMTRVIATTPEPLPLAGVGGEAPPLVMEACAAAGVEVERSFVVDLGASREGMLRSRDGRELAYDAAFLVPPHVRAGCLSELPGDGPLVAVGERGSVDGTALYVIGDAAATGLPRAAGVARASGVAAADGALEAIGIAPAPPPGPIEAACFMFHAGGAASRLRVTVDGSRQQVEVDPPSLDLLAARDGELRRFVSAAAGRQ